MADKNINLEEAPSQDSINYVPYMIGLLSSEIRGMSLRMDEGFRKNDEEQKATNAHLKQLNGKVIEHQKRLDDQDQFRESVTGEAKKKAESAAGAKARRVAALWAILVSVVSFVVIGLLAWGVYNYLHIDLRSVINPN